MKNLFFLFLLVSMFCAFDANMFQLCKQMNRYIDNCLKYIGYGCFCGWGSRGKTAVDEIDECCKAHDLCYKEIKKEFSCKPKLSTYKFNNGNCGEISSFCILKRKVDKTFESQSLFL